MPVQRFTREERKTAWERSRRGLPGGGTKAGNAMKAIYRDVWTTKLRDVRPDNRSRIVKARIKIALGNILNAPLFLAIKAAETTARPYREELRKIAFRKVSHAVTAMAHEMDGVTGEDAAQHLGFELGLESRTPWENPTPAQAAAITAMKDLIPTVLL